MFSHCFLLPNKNEMYSHYFRRYRFSSFMSESCSCRCFSSWVEFGITLDAVTQLVDLTFASLPNDQLFEAAVESLINAFTKNDPSR